MSNDIKGVSFRLSDEDIQKFRMFAEEQGMNQAEMFQAMINNFEIARAKNSFSDRAKEIETFQVTVNTLVGMFVNSLAVNQTSEERIRGSLSVELITKDKLIAALQTNQEKLKTDCEKKTKALTELEEQFQRLLESYSVLSKEFGMKDMAIKNYQSQVDALNETIVEYKAFKDKCKEVETVNAELNKQLLHAQNENTALLSKIENLDKMKDFYQDQVKNMQEEAKETAKRVIERDQEYKEMFNTLTKQHKEELEKQKQELTTRLKEDFDNKIALEKSKHQLELDSLRNREKNSVQK